MYHGEDEIQRKYLKPKRPVIVCRPVNKNEGMAKTAKRQLLLNAISMCTASRYQYQVQSNEMPCFALGMVATEPREGGNSPPSTHSPPLLSPHGYSWFDGLLRNPRSGVQTPQVLGYSGMRVALNPRSGVQTPTRWRNPPRSGVGVPHVQSGYTLAQISGR